MGAVLLKYSNGWGHLIITVVCIAALTIALIMGKINEAAAAAILSPVVAFWFMSGSANRFNPLNPSAPPPSRGTQPLSKP